MVTESYYMVPKAAEMLGISEDELLVLIKRGKIRAEYRENMGTYMIASQEVLRHLREKRDLGGIRNAVGKRLLLCDRDPEVQSMVKLDIGRRPNTHVRVATSERDVAIQVDEFMPDVILIHLGATLRAKDRVQDCLKRAREKINSYIILYHNMAPAIARENKDVQRQAKAIGADEIVCVYGSTRPLLEAVYKRL